MQILSAIYKLYEANQKSQRSNLLIWLLIMYLGVSYSCWPLSRGPSVLATAYRQRSRIFGALASSAHGLSPSG